MTKAYSLFIDRLQMHHQQLHILHIRLKAQDQVRNAFHVIWILFSHAYPIVEEPLSTPTSEGKQCFNLDIMIREADERENIHSQIPQHKSTQITTIYARQPILI